MLSELKTIRNHTLLFFSSAAFLAAMMGLVFADVVWVQNGLPEASFTEVAQELILAVIALLYFVRAWRLPAERPVLVLVGGFFSCLLIRELDFLFDMLSHGSWFWFALPVALCCTLAACLRPQQLIAGLAAFMRAPGWGMLSAGMLTILVFSRLFGMHELWQILMPEYYNRTVKNMAEEGSELLGYSLCLLATLSYTCPWWNRRLLS